MANNLVRLIPPTHHEGNTEPNKWIGRVAIFELITGSRVQGRILKLSENWIDTDNGTIRVEHIVHAKWVNPEEESIIRGGPLGTYDPYRLRR